MSRAQAEENRQQVVAAASHLFREQGAHNVSVADLMKAAGLTHGGFYKQFASKDALQAEATEAGFSELGGSLAEFDARHPGDPGAARAELIAHYLSTAHRDDPGAGCPTAGFASDMARSAPGPARSRYAQGVRHFARWVMEHGEGGAGAGAVVGGAGAVAGGGAGAGAGAVAGGGAVVDGGVAGAVAGAGADMGAGAVAPSAPAEDPSVDPGAVADAEAARAPADGAPLDPEALVTLSTLVGALLLARATHGSPLSEEILAAARNACAARPT
ncbi:TetR/AcrR family transcriptional regulator [Streptantibioticus silvisoli]|uniref:TetR/AcrR family transcriptional regulator n=1 Tax=Streptantibioticus silvisoli TaxID=2705255 RepID=UPI003F6BC620